MGLLIAAAAGVPRTRRGDLGLAAVATAASVTGAVFEVVEAPGPVPPLAGAVAIAAVAGLVVLGRARPVGTAVAVVALCLLYHSVGYPGLAPAVALFVLVYALTADGGGTRSLASAAAVILAVSAVPMLPPQPVGFGWAVAGPAIALVAAAALGEAARARRLAVDEQLRAVRRSAEQDSERRLMQTRIELAREVHDVLAHTITIITVHAAAADEALTGRPDDARTAISAVRGAARDAMTELRGTLAALRTEAVPTQPDRTGPTDSVAPDPVGSATTASIDPGLTATATEPGLAHLDQLAEQATRAGTTVTMTVISERVLPAVVERAVYRIVQEALTNTIRHASARTATVTVDLRGEQVTVEITDDGRASSLEPVTSASAAPRRVGPGGRGLVGMRERVHALGGTLEAGPGPGRGYRVAAQLPARPPR